MIKFLKDFFNTKQQNKSVNKNKKNEEIVLQKGTVNDILVPAFSSDLKKVKVVKYNFKLGDIVRGGDILCEIETEKTIMEFESYCKGKITYLHPKDIYIPVKTKIITIEGT